MNLEDLRDYAEARQWRKDLPTSYRDTRLALGKYIASLRQCWAIERRFPATHCIPNH